MSLLENEAFAYSSLLNEQNINSSYIDFTTLGLSNGLIAYSAPNLITATIGTGLSFDGLTLNNTGIVAVNGTANQINATTISGVTTLSLPSLVSLTNLSIGGLLYSTQLLASNSLVSVHNGFIQNTGVLQPINYDATTDNLSLSYTSNLKLTGGLLDTIQSIATTSSVTFASLTLTGLTLTGLTGVLRASAGVISGSATTSDLPEGTNLYFTTARAQSAITAGTGISVVAGVVTNTAPANFTSISGTANRVIVTGTTALTLSTPQDIGTASAVQFARVLNSSIGTSNVLLGTYSGASLTTGGGNTLVGQGAGNNITSGTFNIGLGANAFGGSGAMTYSTAGNIAIGVSSLYSCTGTAAHNTAVGYLALQSMTTGVGNIALGNSCASNLLTGNNNVYIGQAITASSTSVTGEGAINLTGSGITGKGANTFFINATEGLYHYSAAYCTLVSTSFTSGPLVQWAFFNDGTTTYNKGFTLYNTNTLIVQPFAGLYEFTITANMLNTTNYCQVSYIVTNIGTTNLAFNSPAVSSFLGCVTGCTQYRPYVSSTPTSTGIGIYLNGGNHYGPYPARMTIRFVGL